MNDLRDPLTLAQALIRCASVTPADAGAQSVLAESLERLDFRVERLRFGEIENLFARRGAGHGPHLCFAGHTDVVPAGDTASWHCDPFGGLVEDGMLYGRGACDMKGAIAAFVAACARREASAPGTISLLITGDEEGAAIDGTAKVLEWMRANGETPDFCLVGEPTCRATLGDMVKIGRRGSLNARITVYGVQGHSAYPHRADNPVHRLIRALAALTTAPLDTGSAHFEPSTLQVTSIDVGNRASNVIPAQATAALNVRFNDLHSGSDLAKWIRGMVAEHAERFDLDVTISGEPFLTEPGPMVERLRAAVGRVTGIEPALDTGGGTSDARFIARYCAVAEFGAVGSSMHQVNERLPVSELRALADAYGAVLEAVLG